MIAPRSSSWWKRSSSLLWLASGLAVVVACSNQITYSRIGVELPDSGRGIDGAASPGSGGKGAGGAGGRFDGGADAGGPDAGSDIRVGSGGMIGTGGAGMGGMIGTGGAGMGGMGTGGAGMGGAGGGPAVDTAQLNFEESAQGWVTQPGFTAAARMTAQRFAGAASLGATLTYTPTANGVTQDMSFLPAAGTGPVAGNLITFHVLLPATAAGVVTWVQPFIQDAPQTFIGAYTPADMLVFGGWNTIMLPLPATTVSPIFKIGVQFFTTGTLAFTGTIYVDSISW